MSTITLGWKPFAAHGMTTTQTAAQLIWAMQQFSRVCNFNIQPAGGRTTISVRGWDGNEFAAFVHPKSNTIYVSKIRPMNARAGRVLAMVIMHEICHCRPFSMGHTPLAASFSKYVMHPWGSSTLWWHPAEVLRLQNRYGQPKQHWFPQPVFDTQRNLVEARRAHGNTSAQAGVLTRHYWGQVNTWRAFGLKQINLPKTPLAMIGAIPVAEIPQAPASDICLTGQGDLADLVPSHDGWMEDPAKG